MPMWCMWPSTRRLMLPEWTRSRRTRDSLSGWSLPDGDGSGIDAANCEPTSTTNAEGIVTLHAVCRDLAGNTAEGTAVAQVDLTPPTVTCDGPTPTYPIGGSGGSVTATVADDLSGPVADSVSVAVGTAEVASAGVRSIDFSGYDRAGNGRTVACPYGGELRISRLPRADSADLLPSWLDDPGEVPAR